MHKAICIVLVTEWRERGVMNATVGRLLVAAYIAMSHDNSSHKNKTRHICDSSLSARPVSCLAGWAGGTVLYRPCQAKLPTLSHHSC